MPTGQSCIRRVNRTAPRLVESYCTVCGLLVSASPRPDILAKMEQIHACPVRGFYPPSLPSRKASQGVQQAPQEQKRKPR